jgi:hypothetical protein
MQACSDAAPLRVPSQACAVQVGRAHALQSPDFHRARPRPAARDRLSSAGPVLQHVEQRSKNVRDLLASCDVLRAIVKWHHIAPPPPHPEDRLACLGIDNLDSAEGGHQHLRSLLCWSWSWSLPVVLLVNRRVDCEHAEGIFRSRYTYSCFIFVRACPGRCAAPVASCLLSACISNAC